MKREIEIFNNMPFYAKQILRLVSSVYDITTIQITEKSRKRHIADARIICVERVYHYGRQINGKKKFPARLIGDMFGMDRTVIYHSKKEVENMCDTNDVYKASYEKICEILKTINMTPKENKPKNENKTPEAEKPFQEDMEREEKSMNDYFTAQHENLVGDDYKNEF